MSLTKVDSQLVNGAITTDSSGNVGIGTTPLYSKEDVYQSGTTSRALTLYRGVQNSDGTVATTFGLPYLQIGALEFSNTAGYNQTIGFGYTNGGANPPAEIGFVTTAASGQTYGALVFATRNVSTNTAATERMRMASDGTLLVGTTSQAGLQSNSKFVVTQPTAGAWAGTFNTSAGSVGDGGIQIYGGQADSSTWLINAGSSAGTTKFRVIGNGNTLNSNNSYGSLSDAKLKENIVDASPKLDSLMQVRICNYNMIGDDKKQIGVVAQELETVFPGLVEETTDRDEEGKLLGTFSKSVKYSVFVPMLIKAVQELNAKVDAQALEIQALKDLGNV